MFRRSFIIFTEVGMNAENYYEENKKELLQFLYEAGYTPSEIVKDARKEGLSIYEYIKLFYELNR